MISKMIHMWKMRLIFVLFVTLNIIDVSCGWDTEDLELFDLVEEVNQNFYEVLGLEQTASSSDIRKAYRRLSLQYHPDKSKEEGAEERFRKLVAVSEVLRDEEKRKKYDLILQNGLPDWRQPVYYYRRVRKMGLWELSIFLFVLLTLGQHLFAWSVYWEKKYELEEVLFSKLKKKEKKSKKGKCSEDETAIVEHINQKLARPSYMDLIPVRLVYFLIHLVKSAPGYYQQWLDACLRRKEEPLTSEESEEDETNIEKIRKPKRRTKAELPDFTCVFQPVESPNGSSEAERDEVMEETLDCTENSLRKDAWDESEILALTKAMNKYPGGTIQRWEKISKVLNRSVSEVTSMAKQVRTSSFAANVPASLQGLTGSYADNSTVPALPSELNGDEDFEERPRQRRPAKPKKTAERTLMITQQIQEKSTKGKAVSNSGSLNIDDTWSQHQQKALELALQQFPKGTEERWDRIAVSVPGKTKEECMLRFKMLAEMVKRKKQGLVS
ncbi:dnaJ homolog subfamily C member 1 [Tachypleus tridentatus]|uniref:dnaJ homolog subfamily C member 1 n=1 Tax=Tachypleus tridentatus TaxID=6853 RepID=UPI003FD3EBFA